MILYSLPAYLGRALLSAKSVFPEENQGELDKIEEGSSMEEAALSCGFCDYSAFYRAFKKEYGISPKKYKTLIS